MLSAWLLQEQKGAWSGDRVFDLRADMFSLGVCCLLILLGQPQLIDWPPDDFIHMAEAKQVWWW